MRQICNTSDVFVTLTLSIGEKRIALEVLPLVCVQGILRNMRVLQIPLWSMKAETDG
jgi:hypothetical protein